MNVSNSKKIIYYYQEFTSLEPLVDANLRNVYLYISSIHFGKTMDGSHYIHINDDTPDNQPNLWKNIEYAFNNNIKIMIMMGGAGGAYTSLFSNYEVYYNLLYKFIKKYKIISGIDLDIEERVDIKDVEMLITRLKTDFGKKFIITMAPVAYSMYTDESGLGGFSYKTLNSSSIGKYIDWYNVQCYDETSFRIYDSIVKNGYSPSKIVFGMLGDNITKNTFDTILEEISKISLKFPNMSGVMLWEYYDTKINPITWGKSINSIFSIFS